jgi:integrase
MARKRILNKGTPQEKVVWQADYWYFKNGEKKRAQPYFRTRKEADAKERQFKDEVDKGIHTPKSGGATVAEAAELWLQDCRLKGRRRSTLTNYRDLIDGCIVPRIGPVELGPVKLAQLTRPMVVGFRNNLMEQGRSAHQASRALAKLKAILAHAADLGLVAQNVAGGVRGFEGSPRKLGIGIDVPTQEEVNALIQDAETSPSQVRGQAGPCSFRALVITAAFTGMRFGELVALPWECSAEDGGVDFDDNVIRIRRGANKWGELGETKTPNSKRDLPMMPMVANTLREWQLLCPRRGRLRGFDTPEHKVFEIIRFLEANPGIGSHKAGKALGVCNTTVQRVRDAMPIASTSRLDLVFPSQRGDRPITQSSVCMMFGKLQRKLGMVNAKGRPKYTFHSLRHFFASVALSQWKWRIERVSGYLGHKSVQTTWNLYHHLVPDPEGDQERFAEAEAKFVAAVTAVQQKRPVLQQGKSNTLKLLDK